MFWCGRSRAGPHAYNPREKSRAECICVCFQDEECLRPGDATDTTFLEKLEETVKNHPHFLTWVRSWGSSIGGFHMCDRADLKWFCSNFIPHCAHGIPDRLDPTKNENVFICKEVRLWVMVIQDKQLWQSWKRRVRLTGKSTSNLCTESYFFCTCVLPKPEGGV